MCQYSRCVCQSCTERSDSAKISGSGLCLFKVTSNTSKFCLRCNLEHVPPLSVIRRRNFCLDIFETTTGSFGESCCLILEQLDCEPTEINSPHKQLLLSTLTNTLKPIRIHHTNHNNQYAVFSFPVNSFRYHVNHISTPNGVCPHCS